MDNEAIVNKNSDESMFEHLKDIYKTILKITESIQVLRSAKDKLNSKENKSSNEGLELVIIQQTLDRELNDLDEQYNLAKQLVTNIEKQAFEIINRNDDAGKLKEKFQNNSTHTITKNTDYDSKARFHKVIFLNQKDSNTTLPHRIMVMESMTDFEETCTAGQRKSSFVDNDSCNDSCSHYQSFSDINKDIILVNERENERANERENKHENEYDNERANECENKRKNEYDNERANKCVPKVSSKCKMRIELFRLKELSEITINKNQDLRFKLKTIIQQNNLMENILKLPAPFKHSQMSEIKFPGKKKMEEKLMIMKTEILNLNSEIQKQQTTNLKLKLIKNYINQYKMATTNCQCDSPTSKESIETKIKVKNEQIQQIEIQLKQKYNELCKLISNYEAAVETNTDINYKNQKLNKDIECLKAEIKKQGNNRKRELIDALNKVNEEIETIELIIQERNGEINDIDMKTKEILCETKEIAEKKETLDNTLQNMSEDFSAAYSNLELNFQRQLEEMLALPILLKATHVKLQEETDLRVLAEETKDKLEREIKEAQNVKKPPIQGEDMTEMLTKLEAENITVESRLKSLEDTIHLTNESLNIEIQELDTIDNRVKKIMAESTRHINAFEKFSAIHVDKITNDVQKVQDLLTELQSKECAKYLVKQTEMDQLKTKFSSVNQSMKECKLEIEKMNVSF